MLPLAGFLSLTMLLLGLFFLNRGALGRNRASAALATSRAQFKTIFDSLSEGVLVIDRNRKEIVANPAALSRLGLIDPAMPHEESVNLLDSILPDGRVLEREQHPSYRAMRGDFVRNYQLIIHRKDTGQSVTAEFDTAPILNGAGEAIQFIISYRDVTQRVKAERQNQRLTNFYAALSQTNQAVVHVRDAETLYQKICDICVEYGHARMAYIGMVRGNQVIPEFSAGPAVEFVSGLLIALGTDATDAPGPIATAIQSGHPYICNDFMADPATLPWRERTGYLGTLATAAFPFRRSGVVVGVLSLHVPEKDFFTPELIALLEEMVGDLSFALDNMDREAARADSEVALRASEKRIRNLFEQAADGIFVIADDQRFLEANPAGLEMLGYSQAELLRLAVTDVIAVQEHPRLAARDSGDRAGAIKVEEWLHQRKDGSTFAAEVSTRELMPGQFLAILRDLTPRREAERQSRQAYERFEKIFLGAPEAMSVTEIESGRYVLVNDAYCQTLGYTRQELLGQTAIELGLWIDLRQREVMLASLREGRAVRGVEWLFRTRSGEQRELLGSADSIEMDGRAYTLLMFSDITDRKQAEARVEYLANHDALTGLPNRNLMRDRITQAISHDRRSGRQLAVMYLDLDRFKVINDGYGHSFGDTVLKAAAGRLQVAVREGDTVARQSGDEFLILLADLRKFSDAYIVVQKVLDAFAQPFQLDDREVYVTVSIGVSVYPQNGDNADELISHADVAMYRSKELGRSTYQFFTQEMSDSTRQQLELETRLRFAIAHQEMSLVYQPKVNLATGRIVGCEALLRWQHPELGNVSPVRFIPVAEESGLIVPIGDWVLRTACLQSKAWMADGLEPILMSVNVSARQFLQQDVVHWVFQALKDTGLPPELLELELTESLIAQDTENVIATVAQLKAAKVKLSIDDFGTGYSSLSYLKRFRVDTLKIDQSFIRNMLKDTEDAAIPLAVISMAHSLKLNVIAEGVETAEQCSFLRDNGCDEIQGYYFSKPVSAGEFAQMLRSDRRLDLD